MVISCRLWLFLCRKAYKYLIFDLPPDEAWNFQVGLLLNLYEGGFLWVRPYLSATIGVGSVLGVRFYLLQELQWILTNILFGARVKGWKWMTWLLCGLTGPLRYPSAHRGLMGASETTNTSSFNIFSLPHLPAMPNLPCAYTLSVPFFRPPLFSSAWVMSLLIYKSKTYTLCCFLYD